MIKLKEAYQNMLSKYPDKYVHVVNEYESVYEFLLVNKGEEVTENTCFMFTTDMDKQTGVITDGLLGMGDKDLNNYKQYTQKELERL